MEVHNLPVPELRAYAQALPYLGYLLGVTQMSTLIAREGCCPIRVPIPERFALHKLVVSQIRTNLSAKSHKDILQASAIIDALGLSFPGAIESAFEALPMSTHSYVVKALPAVERILGNESRGLEELMEIASRRHR